MRGYKFKKRAPILGPWGTPYEETQGDWLRTEVAGVRWDLNENKTFAESISIS